MKKSTAQDLLPLIEKIQHLLNKDAFKEIESLLLEKTENIGSLTLEEILTYLRCTFSKRHYYSEAWEIFKEAAIDEVQQSNINPSDIFIGLL